MRKVYILIGLILLAGKIKAQQTDIESQNYKHLHTPSQEDNSMNTQESISEEASLNNQKTHKKSTREYVIAPTNSTLERNVQGRKTKRNYKNQFN